MVEIDGILYILGGEDGERELISMESYDIYSRTWTKQPDLTMVRKVRAPSYLTTLFTGKELIHIYIYIYKKYIFFNLLLQVEAVTNNLTKK